MANQQYNSCVYGSITPYCQRGSPMVNHCANPQCGKPLHYLREGRVYVFDVARYASDGDGRTHRMEHFWLCGVCSDSFLLEQTPDAGIQVSPRQRRTTTIPAYEAPRSIAS